MAFDYHFAVVCISDRCYRKEAVDVSGSTLLKLANDFFSQNSLSTASHFYVIPDDIDRIKELLVYLSDEKSVQIIFTTGGTGLSPTDVTPEATKQIIEKEIPGLSSLMLIESLKKTPFASISRAVCGIRKRTLIINMPGSPKGVQECFEAVSPTIIHAINVICDNKNELHRAHNSSMQATSVKLNTKYDLHPMVSLRDIKKAIFDEAKTLIKPIMVHVTKAISHITYEDIFSPIDVPARDSSLKDGYCCKAPKNSGELLSVVSSDTFKSDLSHSCCKISTGFALPEGADTVIKVEDTENVDEDCCTIRLLKDIKPLEEIRFKGSDISKDELLIEKDTLLLPEHLSLLASGDVTNLMVYGKPRIGILSTGDEICDIYSHKHKADGLIWDANRIYLSEKLSEMGYKDVTDGGVIADDFEAVKVALEQMTEICDILLISGGASLGEKDYVKTAILEIGGKIVCGRVNIKPGKPTSFSIIEKEERKILIFSLPGNPVSCSVMFNILVRDCLALSCGRQLIKEHKVKPKYDIHLTDIRPELLRCKIEDGNLAVPVDQNQQSSRIKSTIDAEIYLLLPGKTTDTSIATANDELTSFIIK